MDQKTLPWKTYTALWVSYVCRTTSNNQHHLDTGLIINTNPILLSPIYLYNSSSQSRGVNETFPYENTVQHLLRSTYPTIRPRIGTPPSPSLMKRISSGYIYQKLFLNIKRAVVKTNRRYYCRAWRYEIKKNINVKPLLTSEMLICPGICRK